MSLVDTIEPILSVDTAYNLQRAVENYEQFVVVRGSWELPAQETYGLTLGARRGAVGALKRRLMINGDMPLAERVDDKFDEALDAAVRLFQARHGLTVSGQVDEATFYALSVPTDYRLNQLRLNLQRIEMMAAKIDDRYVVVNIRLHPSRPLKARRWPSVTRLWSDESIGRRRYYRAEFIK